MDLLPKLSENMVHLARLGLQGRSQDVQAFIRQSIRRFRQQDPQLASALSELLALAPTSLSPLRDVGGSIVPARTAKSSSDSPSVRLSVTDPRLPDSLYSPEEVTVELGPPSNVNLAAFAVRVTLP